MKKGSCAMYEYEDFDPVFDYDEIPHTGVSMRRKPTRYEMDTMTPAEIDAYTRCDEYRYSDM